MEDRELGSISGTGYDYYFAIRENSLFINGYGLINNLNTTFTSPPPPETPTIMPGTVGGLCYIYHYDYRNRVMNKKIPGKGWQYLVYDKLDRPILIQDAKMRLNNQWLFTKYDVFGREIYKGLYTYIPTGSEANEQLELQSIIDSQSSPNWFENKVSTAQTINGTIIYYSNSSYPTTNIDILTINYYDDYNFDNSDIVLSFPESIFDQNVSSQVKTLSTGNKTRVLGTDNWITTLTYYDNKSRPIYGVKKNEYFDNLEISKTNLDFSGKILVNEVSHSKGTNPTITTVDNYTYDHTGRLLTQIQSIDGSTQELITSNTYNKYGQLTDKKVGGSVASIPENSSGLQTVDYAYNIRGWLKSINNGETLAGDLFGFKVSYNAPELSGATSLYNGNISETHWKTANDNNLRSYDYRYDALSRIKTANYHGNYALVDFPSDIEDYSLGNVDYDKNGNITALSRTGYQDPAYGSSGVDVIDNLTYTYAPLSNKLISVSDAATGDGFKDQNLSDDDYSYDVNGNLLTDKNKKIIGIRYNYLNLPIEINFDFSDTSTNLTFFGKIEYVYDASGTKLSKNVTRSGPTARFAPQLTEYAGNYIYKGMFTEDATLNFINHPEGYIEPHESGGYDYVYQYKDHLRNVRITYSDDDNSESVSLSEIRREQNYYPFGLEHKGYNNVATGVENNLKQYQGKEFTEDLELNTHEWKYRVSDPSIGRFWQIDPLAEDYVYNGVYNFAENKVIWAKELEGLESWYTNTGSTNPNDNFLFAPQNGPLTYDYAVSQGYVEYSSGSREVSVRNYNFSNQEIQSLSDWNSQNGPNINGECLACAVRGSELLTGADVGWNYGSGLDLAGKNAYDLGEILANNNSATEINVNQGGETDAMLQSISNFQIQDNAAFLSAPAGAYHSLIVTHNIPVNSFSIFDQGTGWDVKNATQIGAQNQINDINANHPTWGSRLWQLFKNEVHTVENRESVNTLWHDEGDYWGYD